MTFDPIKAGNWAVGEILESAQLNPFNARIPDIVDGGEGGEYTPDDPIEIRGVSALKVDNPVEEDDVANRWYVNQRAPLIGNFTLIDSATAAGGTFDVEATPEFSNGTWSVFGDEAIQVPEEGTYRVDFLAEIDGTSLDGFVEVDILCGASVIGWARGVPASPNKVIGWASVSISGDLTASRFSFKPGNGLGQTPETESSLGQLHKITIQRIGGNP